MTPSPTTAVPLERTAVPLARIARPAAGRTPSLRHAFAVCYAEDLPRVVPSVVAKLIAWTGPTRMDPVDVQTFGRDTVSDTLGDLEASGGQTPDTTLALADAFVTLEGRQPGRDVRLVVGSTRVLWRQTARLAGLS